MVAHTGIEQLMSLSTLREQKTCHNGGIIEGLETYMLSDYATNDLSNLYLQENQNRSHRPIIFVFRLLLASDIGVIVLVYNTFVRELFHCFDHVVLTVPFCSVVVDWLSLHDGSESRQIGLVHHPNLDVLEMTCSTLWLAFDDIACEFWMFSNDFKDLARSTR